MQLYKRVTFYGENNSDFNYSAESHFIPHELTDGQLDVGLKNWLKIKRLAKGHWEIEGYDKGSNDVENNYTKEQMDYIHDTLTDLIISCMHSGIIPRQRPMIGDWCIEMSSYKVDHDHCIGKLVEVDRDDDGDTKYVIRTIGDKLVTWHNAELYKIPDKYLRV